MRTLYILTFLLVASHLSVCQSQAVMDFHNKYKDHGKYLSVRIEGGLLKMFSNLNTNDQDTKEFLDAISKIEGIDIHSINRDDGDFSDADANSFKKDISRHC